MAVVSPYDTGEKMCLVCGRKFRGYLALVQHMEKERPGVYIAKDE